MNVHQNLIVFFFTLASLQHPFATHAQQRHSLTGNAQGTTWLITYYAEHPVIQQQQIDSLFIKIDSSLSRYKPYSLISAFNASSTGNYADTHLLEVVHQSLTAASDTRGAFDATYASRCSQRPTITIKKNFISKSAPCVTLDVDGIAQGYTVDVITDFLLTQNIRNFIAELGGEICVQGSKPDNEPFTVSIETLNNDHLESPFTFTNIKMPSGAITTSGVYRKQNHIIDPATGKPVKNEIVSVTIFAKNAVTADAYDNALVVMGLKKGLNFVNRRKDLAALFIYRTKNGRLAQKQSRQFKRLFDLKN